MERFKSPSAFLCNRRIANINETIDSTNAKIYSSLFDDIKEILSLEYLENSMPNLACETIDEKLNDEILMYFYVQVLFILKSTNPNRSEQLEAFIEFFKANYSYDILKTGDYSLVNKYKLIYLHLIVDAENFKEIRNILDNVVCNDEKEITRFISIIQNIKENYPNNITEMFMYLSTIYTGVLKECSLREANDLVISIIEIYTYLNKKKNLKDILKEFSIFCKNVSIEGEYSRENETGNFKFNINVESEEVVDVKHVCDASITGNNLNSYFSSVKDVYRTSTGNDFEKVLYSVSITGGLINVLLKVNALLEEFRIDEFLLKLDFDDDELEAKLILLENSTLFEEYGRDKTLVRYLVDNFEDRYASLLDYVRRTKSTDWFDNNITGTRKTVNRQRLLYKKP